MASTAGPSAALRARRPHFVSRLCSEHRRFATGPGQPAAAGSPWRQAGSLAPRPPACRLSNAYGIIIYLFSPNSVRCSRSGRSVESRVARWFKFVTVDETQCVISKFQPVAIL